MKIHFLGANRQVTGSRYCLEAAGTRVLVDCGLFQERPFVSRNWEPSPVPPADISAIVLTHVHIDHSGLIPRFVREGFAGPIHMTRPSVELLDVMLRDAAKIQTEDAAYKKKRHEREGRKGKYPEEPLYTVEDAEQALPLARGVPYGKPVALAPGLSVVFHDAGHILGSAMLEFLVDEHGRRRRVVFSGDIGQHGKPLIRDPSVFRRADIIVMESTYGDRDHEAGGEVETQLCDAINDAVRRGGNVVIPTFAVERAQELMYHLSRLVHSDRIPDIKVFLDSPMAVDVTEIFRHFPDCLDQETWELINSSEPPLRFAGLHLVRSGRESKAINDAAEPCVIMSTSGMCTSGRIKHHLRHNVGRAESTILFVGYQAEGTLGRQILDGKREVRIHGQTCRVRAKVTQVYGFSGHADRRGLLEWLGHLEAPPRCVYLTHGEDSAADSLAAEIRRRFGYVTRVPEYLEVADLEMDAEVA